MISKLSFLKSLKHLKILIFASVLFMLSGCEIINNPVKDFFSDNLSISSTSSNSSGNSANSDDNTGTDDSGSTSDDSGSTSGSGSGGDTQVDDDADIDLTTTFVYYVSNVGDDDANSGEKTSPFATVDKALSQLKTDFQAEKDSQNTEKIHGYVFLLTDIDITSEISLETYLFADLSPNIVDLTISGFNAQRTINAGRNSRVMKIGYTNGDITLKKLKFEAGSVMSVGGAGIYVSSTDCTGKKLNIENCIISDCSSGVSGAALYAKTDYEINITDSQITNNTSSDGAAAIHLVYNSAYSGLILKNTKVEGNYSVSDTSSIPSIYDYGYVIQTEGSALVKLSGGVSITDNRVIQVSATSDSSLLSAVKNSLGLRLAGANTIKDNYVDLTDGKVKVQNIIFPVGLTGYTFYINDDCSGSSIGVAPSSSSLTSDFTFTTGYGTYNSAAPSAVFESDCAYAIGYDSTNNAAFKVNSANMTNPLAYSVTFAASPTTITAGEAATITVTPAITYNDLAISSSLASAFTALLTWNLNLYNGTYSVAQSTTSTITLTAAQALPDIYKLAITATLYGIAYDDEVSIVCAD